MIDRVLRQPVGVLGTDGRDGHPENCCPVCHETDALAMVSGVSRAGRGRFMLANGHSGQYETELSVLLAEPPRPRELPLSEFARALVAGAAMVALTLGVVAALRWQDFVVVPSRSLEIASMLGLAWFGVLIPVVALFRYLESRHHTSKAREPWREAVSTWRAACYCSRDDVVFLVGQDVPPAAPEDAHRLWTSEHKPRLVGNGLESATLEQATR